MPTVNQGEERLLQEIKQYLQKHPEKKLMPISNYLGSSWETILSAKQKGIIEVLPFPQGNEVYVCLV